MVNNTYGCFLSFGFKIEFLKSWSLHYTYLETLSLQCRSPIITNIDLLGVDLGGFLERLCERLAQPFSTIMLETNLLMASTFPLAYPFPEWIQECMHMYNVSKGHILKKDGSVLLDVNRDTMASLFHLEE